MMTFTYLFLIPKCITSLTDLPPGLNITQVDRLTFTEVPNDFGTDNTLFEGSMLFEWERSTEDSTKYPVLICNVDNDKSGYERLNVTVEDYLEDGEKIWVHPFFNKDDITCLTSWMDGNRLIESFSKIPDDETDEISINPITQSITMSDGTVDEIQDQMNVDSSVKLLISISPGVVQSGTSESPIDAGNEILDSIIADPTKVPETSYFYKLVNEGESDTTERMEFWKKSFDDGFLMGDNCKPMMEEITLDASMDEIANLYFVAFEIKLSSTPATEREQACVWSIIQGIALHPFTIKMEPQYEMIPKPPASAPTPSTGSRFSYHGSFVFAVGGFILHLIFTML